MSIIHALDTYDIVLFMNLIAHRQYDGTDEDLEDRKIELEGIAKEFKIKEYTVTCKEGWSFILLEASDEAIKHIKRSESTGRLIL